MRQLWIGIAAALVIGTSAVAQVQVEETRSLTEIRRQAREQSAVDGQRSAIHAR